MPRLVRCLPNVDSSVSLDHLGELLCQALDKLMSSCNDGEGGIL